MSSDKDSDELYKCVKFEIDEIYDTIEQCVYYDMVLEIQTQRDSLGNTRTIATLREGGDV